MIDTLETHRLILRPFVLSDIDSMAAINASKQVMRYFPEPYSVDKTVHFIERVLAKYQNNQRKRPINPICQDKKIPTHREGIINL